MKKIYLLEYIAGHKCLRSPSFWREIIEEMVRLEVNKFEEMNPKESKLCSRLSDMCFSQLLPYSINMYEFYLDYRLIIKIIDEYVLKYNLQKDMRDAIFGVFKDKIDIDQKRKEYLSNPNLENELLSIEDVKKLRGII